MRQIVMITQWINFSLVIIELWAVFINMRKKTHYYLFLNGIATLIYSVGSILMHYVESEESYYIFFMFTWAGKVGAVVTTLLFCVKICDNKLPVVITAIESGLATIACVIIVTTNKTGLFYKGYYLVKEKGLTIIECEPGPLRAMWPATVIIVILTCLFMITKSLAKEKNIQKRKQYIVILMALVTEIAIGFLMELPIGRYYDFNQLGFSLCIILVVFAIFHGNFMDAETMAKDYVIDELSAGVIAMDKDEMVAYYNKKILQVFPDMILDEHGVIAKIAKSVETGEPITIQDKIYNFEERKLVQNSSDRSKLYVMIDSTKHYQHLRELEQEKQIADAANRAKSEFLASMSHEIRTPINAVLGMDEMILRECKDSTIKEYATDIQAAGNTLLTIINNILDLNKIESGKMEIIPVEYDVAGAIYHISNMINKCSIFNFTFIVIEFKISREMLENIFTIPGKCCKQLFTIIPNKKSFLFFFFFGLFGCFLLPLRQSADSPESFRDRRYLQYRIAYHSAAEVEDKIVYIYNADSQDKLSKLDKYDRHGDRDYHLPKAVYTPE